MHRTDNDKPTSIITFEQPPQGGIFLPEKPIPEFVADKLGKLDDIYEDSLYAGEALDKIIGSAEGLERIGRLTTYFVKESLRKGGEVPEAVRAEVALVEDLMFRAAGYTDICGVLQQHGEKMARWVADQPELVECLGNYGYGIYEEHDKKYLTITNTLGRRAIFNYFRRPPMGSEMQFVQPADHFYLLHQLDELATYGYLKPPVNLTKRAPPRKKMAQPKNAEVETSQKTIVSSEEQLFHKRVTELREGLCGLPLVEAWNRQNQLFLAIFQDLLKPDISIVSQHGVGPDGGLLDLKDIKVQLERQWLGVLTLKFKNDPDSAQQHWILRAAEADYKGFCEYEIPTEYKNGAVTERYFAPQHMLAYEGECEGSYILPWALEIMMDRLTISQAEILTIARYKLYLEARRVSEETDTKMREKTQKEIAKLLKLLMFK